MDSSSSKNQVHTAKDIDTDVVNLLSKLYQDDMKLDLFVQQEILKALSHYLCIIKKQESKFWFLFNRNTSRLHNLIREAEGKVKQEYSSFTESAEDVKKWLLTFYKDIENGDVITDQHYQHAIERIFSYLQNFYICLSSGERLQISILIFKLFVKSSSIVCQVLGLVLAHVHQASQHFNRINTVSSYNLEEVKSKLNEVNKELDEFSKRINNLALPEGNILQQADLDLNNYESLIGSLSLPLDEKCLRQIEEKISRIRMQFKDHSSKNKTLLSKAETMLKKLQQINIESKEILGIVKTLEEDRKMAIVICQSKVCFKDKTKALLTLHQKVKNRNATNCQLSILQTSTLTTIDAFLLSETLSFLRQIKQSIDYYKNYAQHFASGRNGYLYQVRVTEIRNLRKDFSALPIQNKYVEERVQCLDRKICEVLHSLEQAAERNEAILLYLKQLDECKDNLSNGVNVDQLLFVRSLIKTRIWTEREYCKKMDVLQYLHISETQLYLRCCFSVVYTIKAYLDDLEIKCENIDNLLSSDEIKKAQMKLVKYKAAVSSTHFFSFDARVYHMLLANIDSVMECLKQAADINQHFVKLLDIKKCLDDNQFSKCTLLTYKERVLAAKNCAYCPKLSKMVAELEARIQLEVNRMKLTEAGKQLKELLKQCDFLKIMEKLQEVFEVKDLIDDILEMSPELTSQKQTMYSITYEVLAMLDEDVAKHMKNAKEPQKFLEIHKQFQDFGYGASGIVRESVHFVKTVRDKARFFESDVMCFWGSKSSVDYYVIKEHLNRLVGELDKIIGEDEDVLNETVNAMDYIQGLLQQLDTNATNK